MFWIALASTEAASQRNGALVVLWIVIFACGLAGVGLGALVLWRGWGPAEKIDIDIGPFKARNISLGVFIALLGLAALVSGVTEFAAEIAKEPNPRCGNTGAHGPGDPAHDDRQPTHGTACVNSDEVASFYEGQFRVTLLDLRAGRIRAAILETAGDRTPLATRCPFVWRDGTTPGSSASIGYTPPAEVADKEDSVEWTVHIESVRKDSAQVFVSRQTYTYSGQLLARLRRRNKNGFGVECRSSGLGNVLIEKRPG